MSARVATGGWCASMLLSVGGLCAVVPATSYAHDARPLSIVITEHQVRGYAIQVRVPPSVDAENRPVLTWPGGCNVRSHSVRDVDGTGVASMFVTCTTPLDGQRITFAYPLYNPSLTTLVRFSPASGGTRTAVLPPDRSEWVVPAATNWTTVARDYLVLGIEHIWAGIDHLLFVFGLLLLARTPRRIALAITGFTLAHSVTLSLSALGVVRLPVPPIEAGIALSILFLAREIARPDAESLARRFPLAISSTFGLLHGFGFAAALSETGLPRGDVAAALLFFNAGVEVGQMAFIALLLVAGAAVFAATRRIDWAPVRLILMRAQTLGGYALGIPASFWFLQRLQLFWPR